MGDLTTLSQLPLDLVSVIHGDEDYIDTTRSRKSAGGFPFSTSFLFARRSEGGLAWPYPLTPLSMPIDVAGHFAQQDLCICGQSLVHFSLGREGNESRSGLCLLCPSYEQRPTPTYLRYDRWPPRHQSEC
jgi:hypothetical protein